MPAVSKKQQRFFGMVRAAQKGMPIAKDGPDVGEWLPENGDEPPRPEEEVADIHQKMYEIATSKYNPFSIGGSENIHDFDRKD